MKYMGSKGRIAKDLLPIMLSEARAKALTKWVEPFVGGGNLIDKVPPEFARFGYDVNPHTIAALVAIRDMVDDLPEDFTEGEYRAVQYKAQPSPITSLARHVASFSGRFDEGFARGGGRNFWKEGVRNAKKQAPNLRDVTLECRSYLTLDGEVQRALVYCDPPYKGTKGYRPGLVPAMDYDQFWDWCRCVARLGSSVYVSEYQAPDDFMCVWSGQVRSGLASTRRSTPLATEKLFKAPS